MATTIFLFTLILAIWRPRGLGIGWSALLGAVVALATGVVSVQDVLTVWTLLGNATLSLISLLIIALILEQVGFWRWLALLLAYWGGGHGRVLFVLLVLLGTLVTALLSNCTTAFVWTAAVLPMLRLLGFRPRAALAFVFALGFMADTASLVLPMSNPVNLITIDYFNISVLRYVMVMLPIHLVAIATSLGVLLFFFERSIPAHYDYECLPSPASVIRDPLVCRWSFAVFGLLLLGYALAQTLAIPVSAIAAIAALMMLALAGRWFHNQESSAFPLIKVLRQVPWHVIGFSLAMSLLMLGLHNMGITGLLGQRLVQLSGWGLTLTAMGVGFFSTVLSCLINQLPTGLLNAQAIVDTKGIDPAIHEVMVYANVIGCNLGAKLTPFGSLSTLLWLDILNRQGLRIRWERYLYMALALTLPVLFVTLLALTLWLPWLIA